MGTFSSKIGNLMKRDDLLDLMRSGKTVFTFKDVFLLWGDTDKNYVKKKIHRYIKAGKLYAIRKGIYVKDQSYDRYELAVKIYTPAYISFETVLGAAGVTFQFYSQIFIASYQNREIECDGQKFSYLRIKNDILTNTKGLETKGEYTIASPERAFLDVIYRHNDYHFDNLSPLNWDKVYDILPVYDGNKRMAGMVNKYFKAFKKEME